MHFAEKLKALRNRNNLTQDELAKLMNLARSTIAGYEKKNRQPSYEVLARFADFFHVSIDYLLTGRESVYIASDSGCGMVNGCAVSREIDRI